MPALQLLHNSGNRRLGSLASPSPPTLPLRAGKPERSLYLSPRVSESDNGTSPKTIIASLPGGSADTVGDPWRKFVRNHYWLDILTVKWNHSEQSCMARFSSTYKRHYNSTKTLHQHWRCKRRDAVVWRFKSGPWE